MELQEVLRLQGESCFRSKVILATLSGKTLRLENIRSDGDMATASELGLRDYEVAFLKLIEKVSNGSVVEINDTGTTLYYRPGILVGGVVVFEAPLSRAVGYYLEMLIPLAPFSKLPWQLTLTGITSDEMDPSVDSLRLVSLMALRKFGIQDGLDIKIMKRGARPLGGGEVLFSCPIVKSIGPLRSLEPGKMKRIRGTAACTRVSPQVVNRLAESARSLLGHFIHDIVIYTDVHRGAEAGKSPGFSLTLVAESTTGVLITAEGVGLAGMPPEQLGLSVAKTLLSNIQYGGTVDAKSQWLYLLYMTLASEDVSSLLFSELTPFTVQFLRDLKTFMGVVFKLKQVSGSHPNETHSSVIVSGLGIGYVNYSMRST